MGKQKISLKEDSSDSFQIDENPDLDHSFTSSLVAGYSEYCKEAEQLAINSVILPDAPVFSCLLPLCRSDLLLILKHYRDRMGIKEQAIMLSAITDYVSCTFNEASHTDTFQRKQDRDAFNNLLKTLNNHWRQFLSSSVYYDEEITTQQLKSLLSLLKSSTDRLKVLGRHYLLQESVVAGNRAVMDRMRADEMKAVLNKSAMMKCKKKETVDKKAEMKAKKRKVKVATATAPISMNVNVVPVINLDTTPVKRTPVINLDTTPVKRSPVKCKSNVKENVPNNKKKSATILSQWMIDLTKIHPDISVTRVQPQNVLKENCQNKSNASAYITKGSLSSQLEITYTDANFKTPPQSFLVTDSYEPPLKKRKSDATNTDPAPATNVFALMMKRSKEAFTNLKRKALF